MNEELIRQVVYDTVHWENYPSDGGFRTGQEDAAEAIRRYHTRAVAPLVEALKPFALIAELDIGDDEVDSDLFRPLTHNYAPHITVGHLRAALKALAPFQQEAKHDQL